MLTRHSVELRSRSLARRQKFLNFFRPLHIEPLEDRALLTITPQLVADINPTVGQTIHAPEPSVEVGGVAFFAANDGVTGTELWKSDGTIAGTTLVKDIAPGNTASRLFYLTNVNGTLFFCANDEVHGYELWKSDGTTAGTTLIKDIYPGTGGGGPGFLTNVNGTLFFGASDVAHGFELWKIDGTEAGTTLVKDINVGSDDSFLFSLVNVSGTLFFNAYDGVHGGELWKSDGTTAGTALMKDIWPGATSSTPLRLTNVNGTLFFRATDDINGTELWKSNGTTAGTTLVKDISPGAGNSDPNSLINVNGMLFLTADDGASGRELWKSDGTSAGTERVKDSNPGAGDGVPVFPYVVANMNGVLYFTANDGTSGFELWKSDGTAAGTTLLKDIDGGPGSGFPEKFANVNGTLFFGANDGTTGSELWKSDGTTAGTSLVKEVAPGTSNGFAGDINNVNGMMFFRASDGAGGLELWKSDGTAAGTISLSRRTADSMPTLNQITKVGSLGFFAANDGAHGVELWKTDGTPAGTALIKDIRPGGGDSKPSFLTNMNGTLFFQANDGTSGFELWKSDGTAAGTTLVADINAGPGNSYPNVLVNQDGTLYFVANDGAHGFEPWKSDGTAAETMLVKDIVPGPASSFPGVTINVNGMLFFHANDGAHGSELWKTAGTPAGTTFVRDVRPGPGGSSLIDFVNVDGTLFFAANDGFNGYELWKSDGTAAGTTLVKDIRVGGSSYAGDLTNVNGTLFFVANDGITGYELWRSDAQAGAVLVKDTDPASDGGVLRFGMANVNGTLFFDSNDGIHGVELWKSDGTESGTVLVTDIDPSGDSVPYFITNVDGALFFQATNGRSGNELWESDGTANGAIQLADIAPAAASSFPTGLVDLGGRLIFVANDIEHGRELWSATLYDFGDAAASFGTSLASGGPRHLSIGPQLGPLRDEETDAVPSAAANSDDSGGSADEDGLVASSLLRGQTSSVTVDVVTNGGTAKLDAWVDFDHDGSFAPLERIAISRTVTPGQATITFVVPSTAHLGPTPARFRISTAGGLSPIGRAADGEVEDHLLTISQDLAVSLATENGIDRISIRQNAGNIEVFDLNASQVIATSPLAFTNSVVVSGSPKEPDEMTVDYSFGGLFSLSGGTQLDGGANDGDLLTVIGADGSTTTATYLSQGLSLGNATLRIADGGVTSDIRFTSFEPLTINNISLLEIAGVLNVGADTLTVNAGSFIKLGLQTNLQSGKIIAPQGVTLGTGQTLRGSGMIAGRVAADIGSTIAATGALSIGDAASPDGFFSRGELRVLDHTVALLDSNQAVLGSLTRLGNAGVGGALNSPHGILLDFGNNIVGFGTINTPNDVLRPVINNGVITGNSPVEKITLTGYIKGVGSLDNVLVAGTSSPGFSPAAVYFGSVDFGSTSKLIAELEGLLPGSSGYDQLNFSGTAAPAGTLNVELINGFVPNVGNTFTLITAAGGITGAFDAMMLPGLPEYWYWQPTYSASELRLSVQTTRPRHNSRNPLDVTGDGHVAPNDALAVINRINAFGSGPPPPNPNNLPDFYDTSGDNFIGPNDALRVINAINAGQGGEGPSDSLISSAASPSINWAALLDLLALDIAERGAARKFR